MRRGYVCQPAQTNKNCILETGSGLQQITVIGQSRNTSQVHLTDIVKVSMWDFLLCCQLFHLIQQDVHLKLGAEILQTTVAEGLSVARGNKKQTVCAF